MQKRAIDPWTWHEALDFSHGIEVSGVERTLYIAGQAAFDGNGAVLQAGDMFGQFNAALDNIETILTQAGMKLSDLVRLNIHVTDMPAFHEAQPKMSSRLKAAGCSHNTMLLGVASLAHPDLLIELEGIAVV